MTDLSRGSGIQLRVISALILRELHTRYGRQGIGFAWFIGEPLVFTFGVVILWSQTRGLSEHGISLIAFTITGYTPLVMWRHCFAQSVTALKSNGSLLYHRQVTFLDVVIARSIIEISGAILTFAISIAVFGGILKLIDGPQGNVALLIAGLLLFAWFCLATALVVGPITELSHTAEKLSAIFGYIMIPLSGAFWMVDWLPDWLQSYAVMMPTVSAYEMIRSGYFGEVVRTSYDPLTACFVCGAMTFVGLFLMKIARNRLVVE